MDGPTHTDDGQLFDSTGRQPLPDGHELVSGEFIIRESTSAWLRADTWTEVRG